MEDGIDVLLEDVTDINAEVKAGVPLSWCPQRGAVVWSVGSGMRDCILVILVIPR